jgi:hypothetical protein
MGFDPRQSDEQTRVVSLPAPRNGGPSDPFDGDDPPDSARVGFAVGGAVEGPWKLTLVAALVVLVVLLSLDGEILGRLFSR